MDLIIGILGVYQIFDESQKLGGYAVVSNNIIQKILDYIFCIDVILRPD